MSTSISIASDKRELLGSANARRLRRTGQVPAVVYSKVEKGSVSIHLQVAEADVAKIEHHAGLVELAVADGSKYNVITKDIQFNPISGRPLSVEFQEVKAGQTVTVTVPVEAIGEPAGIKQGGQLEQVLHTLVITAAPQDIPEVVKVDVSGIELDQALTVADLKLPEGAKVDEDAQLVVFHVRKPHTKAIEEAETAAPAAEGEAAAAPAEAEKK